MEVRQTPTVEACRALQFPLPLGSAADQMHVASRSSDILHFFLRGAQLAGTSNILYQSLTPMDSPMEIEKIGVVGLGAMGQGMAASLLRAGFQVHGYDLSPLSISKFVENGGIAAKNANETIRGSDVVLLMVQNASQATEVLFGAGRGADELADGAVVILSSTVAPSNVKDLDARLNGLGRSIKLVDAPVSGGVARAAAGTLIVCGRHGHVGCLIPSNQALYLDHFIWRANCSTEGSTRIISDDWHNFKFILNSRCWCSVLR